jgi:MFS family permease
MARAAQHTGAMTQQRLSANRDYNLLWGGQVISELGSQISLFVFPLIVVSMTSSPAQAGLAAAAGGGARLLAGLPAGALVDRWDRKRVMLCCEVVRVLAMASVLVVVLTGQVALGHILVAAVVEGAAAALFLPAEQASLPLVVGDDQLTTAVARNTARGFLATLLGPGVAGVLLGVGRALPFAANAVAYAVSFVALLFVRIPRRVETLRTPLSALPREVAAGLGWLWRNRSVRVMVLVAVGFNLVFVAVYLVAVLGAKHAGVPDAEIGVIGTMLGVGGLAGAAAAPRLQQWLAPRPAMVLMAGVSAVLTPLFVVLSGGWAVGGVLAVMAFLAPTITTIVVAHLFRVTPDALRGRMISTLGVAGGVAGTVGPAAAGLLVEFAGTATAVYVCAVAMAALALVAMTSPALRVLAEPGEPGNDQRQPLRS